VKFTKNIITILSILCLASVFFSDLALSGGGPPPEENSTETQENDEEQNILKKNGLTFDLKNIKRIKAGKETFGSTCAAYCHGHEPDLFIDREGLDEMFVYNMIREGGKGVTPMPPWGEVFSKEEIWELVAYIKSLGKW